MSQENVEIATRFYDPATGERWESDWEELETVLEEFIDSGNM